MSPSVFERGRSHRAGQRLRMILNPDGRTDPDDVCQRDEAEERHAEEQPVVLSEVECHDAPFCAAVAAIDALSRGRIDHTL